METPSASPPQPRLRISRFSQPSFLDTSQHTGPSRLTESYSPIANHYIHENDDHENQEDTPKLAASNVLPTVSLNEHRIIGETPAERLKALLSLVPNDSTVKARRQLPLPQEPSSTSTMDLVDSDSDVAQVGSAHPSLAHESLKALFSRALRDPDTPQKSVGGRARRRNSIDTSEVEVSPRVEKVQRDRNSFKGKRRSMSDDELDPSFKFSRTNDNFKHSQASTFQLLRERLSGSALRDQSISDIPSSRQDNSLDNDSFLRDLNLSHAPATSTPRHSAHNSLKMSLNSEFQSNLLDQDSEMQQAMNASNSYEESQSHEKHRNSQTTSLSTPINRRGADLHNEVQGFPHPSDSKLHQVSPSHHRYTDSKHSPSLHAFPRSTSPAVHAEASSSRSRTKSDAMHGREHHWNRHQTKPATPDLKHRHSLHSPGLRGSSPAVHSESRRTLSRHGSSTSIGSAGSLDDNASQSGSVGSQSEYRELLKQRTIDSHGREREWNKTRPRTNSTASVNSLNDRTHTHSIPSRPSSRLSVSSPSFHHRHRSSSRTGSPTSSNMSVDSEFEREKEIQHEIDHERERNWNSPRPHWDNVRSRTNSDASIPSSPSPVPTTPTIPSYLHKSTNSFRLRAESLKDKARSPGQTQPPSVSPPSIPRLSSRPSSSKATTQSNSPTTSLKSPRFPARTGSPTPPLKNDLLPRTRVPLLNDSTLNIPSYKGHTRTPSTAPSSPQRNRSTRASLIPTSTKGKEKEKPPPPSPSPAYGSSLNFPMIPVVVVDTVDTNSEGQADGVESTDTDEEGKQALEKTPTIKPSFTLPSEFETEAVASVNESVPNRTPQQHDEATLSLTEVYSPVRMSKDEERLQKVLSSPDTSVDDSAALQTYITSPPSPPPSPPSDTASTPDEQPQPSYQPPSTPRRSSFSSTTLSFATPTPPKGLPELPGPPLLNDDTDSDIPHEFESVNATALKTPKPPGAWSYTPAPQRQNGLLRSQSLPEVEEEPQYDSGLATPVSSLSRALSVPPKTPALPGGWMPTPYPKSVRFEKDESVGTDQSALVSDSSVEPESNFKQASERLRQQLDAGQVEANGTVKASTEGVENNGSGKDASVSSISTPPPSNPGSPSSKSPRSKRRSLVNILDEYGREISNEESKPKAKKEKRGSPPRSTVRILDAMGREIDETRSETMTTVEENSEPLSRAEALSRLREGLHDLSQGFEEAQRNYRDGGITQGRIKELRAESEHARQTRQRLQRRVLDEEELKKNFIEPLRASMRRSKISAPAPMKSCSSWLPRSWICWVFLAQILLIFIMYRISVSHATHYFLTTYYDPYYPDIHLYHTNPDYPSQLMSVKEVFWREGLRASAVQVLDNILIFISRLHNSAWRLWGTDDLHLVTTWPPT
ncbi:hypothetical protein E1B28_009961 [Marasmius oreades]|uniref:Uncharacterized protein n=1 Tax=Marasmius oreades TaxID=181124 RepID=A0A9P7RWU9_9AGAR|nr:uncharacterized protein E1B28_009961 [Marasmius oreades]KAG7090880.1 hypothetical protein E1B28_009961 [Marasmius oreades]